MRLSPCASASHFHSPGEALRPPLVVAQPQGAAPVDLLAPTSDATPDLERRRATKPQEEDDQPNAIVRAWAWLKNKLTFRFPAID